MVIVLGVQKPWQDNSSEGDAEAGCGRFIDAPFHKGYILISMPTTAAPMM